MAKHFLLSEDDLKVVRQLVAREKARQGNTTGRPRIDPDDFVQAPETYVARTPSGGIPALYAEFGKEEGTGSDADVGTGGNDEPGYADCKIFQVIDRYGTPRLVRTGFEDHRVYNLNAFPVPGDRFILAQRDKYGAWFVAPSRLVVEGFEEIGSIYFGTEFTMQRGVDGIASIALNGETRTLTLVSRVECSGSTLNVYYRDLEFYNGILRSVSAEYI